MFDMKMLATDKLFRAAVNEANRHMPTIITAGGKTEQAQYDFVTWDDNHRDANSYYGNVLTDTSYSTYTLDSAVFSS